VRYTKSACFFKEEAMNKVEVRLYANLREYHTNPGNSEALVIELGEKAKLGNLLNELKVPKEEVAIAMVNGKSEEENYLLQDGDRIGLFPPIAGG